MNLTTPFKWIGASLLALTLSGCLPIPIFTTDPDSPEAGEPITFDASSSIVSNVPTDTVAVGFSWDFGDGNKGRGKSTTHTYESAGTYDVTLTVTDSAARVGTMKEPIKVKPARVVIPPVIDSTNTDTSPSTGTTTSPETPTTGVVGSESTESVAPVRKM